MKNNNQMDRILLVSSICGFSFMALSFILMPFEGAGILPGLFFWAGLLVGTILQIVLEHRRRKFFKKFHVKREKMQKPRIGLLSFGSNRLAGVADKVMVVCSVATVLALIFTKGTGVFCYFLIAATVLSVCLHCIFNGRIYFHIMNESKIQQLLEQKRQNLKEKERDKNENS